MRRSNCLRFFQLEDSDTGAGPELPVAENHLATILSRVEHPDCTGGESAHKEDYRRILQHCQKNTSCGPNT